MRSTLIQSIRQSPAHDADTWAEQVLVGSVGGGALPTDANPNTTPPPGNRIYRCTQHTGSLHQSTSQTGFINLHTIFSTAAATSITFQHWFFDDTQALWIPYNAPITLTPTVNANNFNYTLTGIGYVFLGSKWFTQITANTGVEVMVTSFV